eukprot:15961254-Heterocapsa_arctica.AAC.1
MRRMRGKALAHRLEATGLRSCRQAASWAPRIFPPVVTDRPTSSACLRIAALATADVDHIKLLMSFRCTFSRKVQRAVSRTAIATMAVTPGP